MQGVNPQDVTLDQAVELLAAKAAKLQARAAKAGVSDAEQGESSGSVNSKETKAALKSTKSDTVSSKQKSLKRSGGSETKSSTQGRKARKPRSPAAGAGDVVQTATAESTLQGAVSGSGRKRGMNAYMQWKQQRWPSLKAEHPNMSFKELMSLTSEEWTSLDPTVKQRFEPDRTEERTQTPQAASS